MSIPESLANLDGHWEGRNSLWLMPGEPADVSDTTLRAATAVRGKFVVLEYSWEVDGEVQAGMLLIGQSPESGAVQVAWVDSWHNGDRMMICEGTVDEAGVVSVAGTYPAPPNPDWGWRIDLVRPSTDSFHLLMFNIPPGGAPERAVEAIYQRTPLH